MTDMMERRILGPNHNRLLTVEEPKLGKQRSGTASAATAIDLLAIGWTEYKGPATAKGGWVQPGTDPTLRPRIRTR
jgi:hypothetical protein